MANVKGSTTNKFDIFEEKDGFQVISHDRGQSHDFVGVGIQQDKAKPGKFNVVSELVMADEYNNMNILKISPTPVDVYTKQNENTWPALAEELRKLQAESQAKAAVSDLKANGIKSTNPNVTNIVSTNSVPLMNRPSIKK